MKVKFLCDWRGNRPGTVRDWPDGAANLLIARKICVKESETPKRRKRNGSKSGTSERV
jgi:hypothetical protein